MRLRTKVQVYGMTDRIYIFVTLYCNCCDCHYFWPIITFRRINAGLALSVTNSPKGLSGKGLCRY